MDAHRDHEPERSGGSAERRHLDWQEVCCVLPRRRYDGTVHGEGFRWTGEFHGPNALLISGWEAFPGGDKEVGEYPVSKFGLNEAATGVAVKATVIAGKLQKPDGQLAI